MKEREIIVLSRRQFLQLSAVGLIGAAGINGARLAHVSRVLTLPARVETDPKRIYIAPDEHTDYFWTADAEAYRQAFLKMLDYYLDLTDTTATNPPEQQSRWNCDGSLWLWTYEKYKPAAAFQRLIERIRDGHISVPMNALCVCLGGAPAEAVLRGMYYPGQIERRYGLRFSLAYTIENQTQPYGLVALWSGAGVKYSWKGICNCSSKVSDPWNREHDIYWWAGPDSSRILMKWNSQFQGSESMGGYAEARDPAAVVEYVDTDSRFLAHYPYRIIGAFGKGWDDFETYTDEFVRVAKEKTNATRKVIVSNEQDFFQDFESTYGAELPTVAASFGNEWELYCASMAEVSALVKRSVEKLRAAEAMATLVNLLEPTFMNGRQTARDLAWMNLGLYWEHDWTADGPVGRDARRDWQRQIATEISTYVETLHTDAASALGRMIAKSGTNRRFYTFNPLSWTRTDSADFPYTGAGPVHVIDVSTNQETPSQLITLSGQQYVRILAHDVPAVGYKVFEFRSGAGQTFPDPPGADAATGSIQNDRYVLTVASRGAITSLQDKTRGNREFAREIDGQFLNDLGTAAGTLEVENAGAVSVTLKATAADPLQHTTRIMLFRESDRIDIHNEITQNFGDTYTWKFGFNLDNPDVWHEEVGAVIRAKLLSEGGHYSPRNARYDWLTLNHFADMTGTGSVGVTLSNADCYYMQLGQSAPNMLDSATPQLSPLVGGQVDGARLGILNQGGNTYFRQRFALQTHSGYDPVAAMRFALEHQNPLVVAEVIGGADTGHSYAETQYSLLTISDPRVLLWALKPADDGIDQGIVARVWNLASQAVAFALKLEPGPLAQASHVTHIETPVGEASITDGMLSDTLQAQQLKTFSMRVAAQLPTATHTSTATTSPTQTPATHVPTATTSPAHTATATNTQGATSTSPSSATATSAPTSTDSPVHTTTVTRTPAGTGSPVHTTTSTRTPTVMPFATDKPVPPPMIFLPSIMAGKKQERR